MPLLLLCQCRSLFSDRDDDQRDSRDDSSHLTVTIELEWTPATTLAFSGVLVDQVGILFRDAINFRAGAILQTTAAAPVRSDAIMPPMRWIRPLGIAVAQADSTAWHL